MWEKRQPAFTLIEIMVTIAIIGILAAAGVNTYIRAMMNGRDGRRKADIAQIAQALVQYRYEVGVYPATSIGYNRNSTWSCSHTGCAGTKSAVIPDYLPYKIFDPANTTTSYDYRDCGACHKQFILCAKLETSTGNASGFPSSGCTFTPVQNGSYQCVTNP